MLDDIDQRILQALVADARMSLKQLAQAVGLSSPSASERLKRLEERGVIKGFTVELDPKTLGYPLQAIVRIRPLPGQQHIVQKMIEEIPQCVECDRVTGDDCFVARLFVKTIDELDEILESVVDRATTNTSIVKAHVMRRRAPPLSLA